MTRLAGAILLILLVLLQWQYRRGQGGEADMAILQARLEEQIKENAALQERNAALSAEVEDLRQGNAALEERARLELGLIKPGETFYRIVETPPANVKPDTTR